MGRRQCTPPRPTPSVLLGTALCPDDDALRAIAETIPAAVVVLQAGSIRYANSAAAAVLGCAGEELIGMDFLDFVAPGCGDRPCLRQMANQDGPSQPARCQFQIVTPSGPQHWLDFSVSPIDFDGKPAVLGIGLDISEYIQAEETIRRQTHLLDHIISNVPHYVFWKDRQSVYLGCNDAFARAAGIAAPEDIVGRTDYDLAWKREEADWYRMCDRKVIDRGEPLLNIEEPQLRADGTQATLLTSKVPLRDSKGSVIGVLGIFADITERKRSEAALRLTQFAMDRAIDAALWTRADGRFFYVNEAACTLLGYSREELLSMSVLDITIDLSAETWPQRWQEIKRRGSMTRQTELRARDGSRIPVEVTTNFMEFEGGEYNCTSVHNITMRKQVERLFHIQSAALNAAANAIVITDHEGRMVFVNPAFSRLTGYSAQEAIGQNLRILKSNLHDDTFYRELWETILAGRVWRGHVCNRRKDGSQYTEEMTITPVRDDSGEISHFIAVKEDVTDRNRAEQALRESEARMRALSDSAVDAILAMDPQGRIAYWNPAAERILGYTRQEAMGRNLHELLAPDRYLGAHRNAFPDFVLTGCGNALGKTLELHARRKDGREITISLSVSAFRIGDGWHAVGILRDVTEQRRTEEALRRSEAQMQTIVENLHEGLVVSDLDGRILHWNRAAIEMHGFAGDQGCRGPLEDLNGVFELSAMDETVWTVDQWPLSRVLRGEELHDLDVRIRRTWSGWQRIFNYGGTLVRDAHGDPLLAVVTIRDVTCQKQAERALLAAAEHQIAVNRLQQELLGPGDLEAKLTKITAAAVRLCGLDFCRVWVTRPADLCSSGCVHAVATDGPHACLRRDQCLHLKASSGRYSHVDGAAHRRVPFGCYKIGCLASGDDPTLVTNEVLTDPRVHDHEWARQLGLIAFAGYRLRRPAGQTTGVLAAFSRHVITPEIDAMLETLANAAMQVIQVASTEAQQQDLHRQLVQAQRLESVGHLAAGIAHEINTPMQYVGDNTRFLRDSMPAVLTIVENYADLLDPERGQRSWVDRAAEIRTSIEALDIEFLKEEVPKAIEQSLEGVERVAKIVRSMKEFSHPGGEDKQPADLNRAIESTFTVARNEWKYVAEMVTDLDPSLPLVPCLLGDFNQAVLNIILNAAHAITDVVGKDADRKGTITVSTRRDGDWAEVCIRDTGTGIPEGIRSRIFDPFFTTKEVGRGTGQGLAIAHNVIVKKHGGTIDVESEVGRGTAFVIRLPIDAPPDDWPRADQHDRTGRKGSVR